MNKILSDWKQKEVFTPNAIPSAPTASTQSGEKSSGRVFINPAVEAANAKSDRERHYALLREKAQTRAEKFIAKANGNSRFKEITSELSKMELSLAKAEMFDPQTLPSLNEQKRSLLAERKTLLSEMGIDETELLPQFTCKKCSDTGFLPSGAACNCYKN
jgi:hypothetical protein